MYREFKFYIIIGKNRRRIAKKRRNLWKIEYYFFFIFQIWKPLENFILSNTLEITRPDVIFKVLSLSFLSYLLTFETFNFLKKC